MKANYLSKISNFDIYKKIGIIGILLLIVSCAAYPLAIIPAPASYVPTAISPSSASTTNNINIRYTLDRSDIPQLTYNAVTLKIFVGEAVSVSAQASGKEIPLVFDSETGFVTVTTSANQMDLSIIGGVQTTKTGSFTKTPLKDDRQWSWSHSFDDNVNFKKEGIPAFDQYGWRATVYLIGRIIDPTRNEIWIVDQPDIVALLEKGWGIGNHSWSHDDVIGIGGANAAKQDIIHLADYLSQVANDSGHPNYRFMSFAAPVFDADYHPIILDLRDSGTTGLLFNESGGDAILRVDEGVTVDDFGIFNQDKPIGRDWRIDQYGANNETDQSFQADLNKMITSLDSTHHYWLNTFTHGVDGKPQSTNIFAFLPWVYNTYGPKGNNSVWVAPSEEIYSYLLVRNRIKVSFTFVDPQPEPTTILTTAPTSVPIIVTTTAPTSVPIIVTTTVVPTRIPTRDPVDSCLYFLPLVKIRP